MRREEGERVKDGGRFRKEERWEESKEGGMEEGREEEGWDSGRKGQRESGRKGRMGTVRWREVVK